MSKDASGQVDPKKTNGEKRVKRGRLHFTEEEVTHQAGEQASGQVGPKSQSTGKFRQDGEREKPSSRLRQEGEAREDTVCEEQAARKDQKDKREKKKERAEAKGGTFRCPAGNGKGKAIPSGAAEAAQPSQTGGHGGGGWCVGLWTPQNP